ncbi:FAD-dependent oxidoreductase [Altererythrobacter sp. B11]|uniref:NAD(P)/FAD-dependent oxidoreductase n=1 Tax=Altererythrobacter sp. B11 TaxID=2060312 RepID=UPI000DC70A65|nr:FAD-dependent oxidoreductase [Altererythrobacter sp. B11]BBC74165.1 FAD-dependent oxidoreductase [Altererythrobacter sp. B11]
MTEQFDVVVIGAGMAGASLAAELAPHARVLIAEAEAFPGYHTTGRSAAFWEECYGGPDVVPLTLASGPYLREHGFLSPRGALYVAREGEEAEVEAFFARFAGTGVEITALGRAALRQRLPGLRPEWGLAIAEPACADIDVAGLHQHYLAAARRGGVQLRTKARLTAAEREGAGWRLAFADGSELRTMILANAAGAWADAVASLAGAHAPGIQPLRRTVAQLRTDPAPADDLPLVLDLAGSFYFKPESGRLWLSPHDETPSPACDAAPEEIDVALAIDRFEQVVDWKVVAVERKWAGLRSFAPDRRPVYGHDPAQEGFFWFAGQGGFGIQTAPAAARLGAQLLLGRGRDNMTVGLDAGLYSPARFSR